MKKSKLNIIQNENKITIKKKTDVSNCVIFAGVFLAGILLPIIFGELRDVPLFWVVYAFCMLANIAKFTSTFFGKVVIDSEKREINIYNLCRETYRFDELKELKSFFHTNSWRTCSNRNRLFKKWTFLYYCIMYRTLARATWP